MFGEVSAALSSVKAMTEIVKGMAALKQVAEVNALTAELTGAIIEVQQRLMSTNEVMESLHKRIRDLEAQLAENKKLDEYERVKLQTNVIVYAPKSADGKEAHDYFACPVCIEKHKTVITLQHENGDEYLRCKGCGGIFLHTPQPQIDVSSDGGYY